MSSSSPVDRREKELNHSEHCSLSGEPRERLLAREESPRPRKETLIGLGKNKRVRVCGFVGLPAMGSDGRTHGWGGRMRECFGKETRGYIITKIRERKEKNNKRTREKRGVAQCGKT